MATKAKNFKIGSGFPRTSTRINSTLMVPDTQNRYLSNIHSQYRSSLKEQGINPLYICFGFLEWKENPTDKKPKYAPLLMLQVSMGKKANDNKHNESPSNNYCSTNTRPADYSTCG